MKNMILIFVCLSTLISCKTGDDPTPQMTASVLQPPESAAPTGNAQPLRMGSFSSFAHNLSGSLTLYADSVNNKILQFENYTMNQGPDVYIFLSKSNNYSNANVIKIAKLTENYNDTSISVNIDPAVDLDTYKFVLIYCLQYNSLFGFAELKKL